MRAHAPFSGFLLPAAAAVIAGVGLAAARTDHAGTGPWIWKNGYEYVLVLAVVAVAAVFAGPGAVSVDHALGLTLSGTGWGVATAAAGLASGGAVLALRRQPTPSAVPVLNS